MKIQKKIGTRIRKNVATARRREWIDECIDKVVGLAFSLAFCLVCLMAGQRGSAQQVWADLGTLGADTYSGGLGINNIGQVVGISSNSASYAGGRAFLWQPTFANANAGVMTGLGTLPGFVHSRACSISSYGQVAGTSSNATDWTTGRAFLWTPHAANATGGSMIDLGALPGYANSYACAVNSYGQVAGVCDNGPSTGAAAFLWTPAVPHATTGTMQALGTIPHNASTYVYGLNNYGQVVGSCSNATSWSDDYDFWKTGTAFLWTPTLPNGTHGTLTNLGAAISLSTYGFAINNAGDVAYQTYGKPYYDIHGYGPFYPVGCNLWTPTRANGTSGTAPWGKSANLAVINGLNNVNWITDCNTLSTPTLQNLGINSLQPNWPTADWNATAVGGINDTGQMVGTGTHLAGNPHVLLLNPAPLVTGGCTLVDTNGGGFPVAFLSPVPAGGVSLQPISNSAPVQVPATVNVASASNTASIPVTTSHVAGPTTANIKVTYPLSAPVTGITQGYNSGTILLLPLMNQLSFKPASLKGGLKTTGTLTFNLASGGPSGVPAGGTTISLTSSDPAVTVPAHLTLSAGTLSTVFPVTTVPVGSNRNVTITAVHALQTVTGTLTLLQPAVATFTIITRSVQGGQNATASISTDYPAPAGGLQVQVLGTPTNGGSTSYVVPTTAIIPAGTTTVTFTFPTREPPVSVIEDVQASAGGATLHMGLKILH